MKMNGISSDEKLNLYEIDYRMAFTIQSTWDSSRKIDPKIMKFVVYTLEYDSNGNMEIVDIPYHRCT